MHGHRQCLVILTTFYHMCHLLYSATGDVVKVVYNNYKKEKRSCMYFIVVFDEYAISCIRIHSSCIAKIIWLSCSF